MWEYVTSCLFVWNDRSTSREGKVGCVSEALRTETHPTGLGKRTTSERFSTHLST
ncbi:hypothetical protein [Okeania sp. SIO2B3]|uniref:hypothetical protein n=1 Tax=Okeania sp. SIO2B3 TaxID=2607784 RepID=UPI0013BF3A31|nr:hypothetical protein [Okeania sp. SIO2B3]NET45241.1 hypothetical protein [Okeania sp. SIO2B3]